MISAILLGAGESKRMGVDKLSLPWGGETVFKHCFNTLFRSRVNEIVVVLSKQNEGMKRQFEMGVSGLRRKIKVVVNPYTKRGMSTSIRRGLQVMHRKSGAILISLGDQPFLKTRTINALIRAFELRGGGIVVPSFRGRKGHPVIFHRRYARELMELSGDMGGKSVLLRNTRQIKIVPVKSEGVVEDIDTWKAYQKALRMRRGRDEKSDSTKVGKRTR